MTAIIVKRETNSLNSEPKLIPKAIPEFSTKVILKRSPQIGILCPWYIPRCWILKIGKENPLI
jgi:hypothetical protein